MNVAFNNSLRLISTLTDDLHALETSANPPPSLSSTVSGNLTALLRCVQELEDIKRKEITSDKREKAAVRASKAQTDYQSLKAGFDAYKARTAAKILEARERNDLLQRHSYGLDTTMGSGTSGADGGPPDAHTISMEHFSKEELKLHGIESSMDDYLTIAKNSLSELVEQRGILKGVQRKLLDIGNSLGLSQTVMRLIERRSTQDTYFMYGGVLFTTFIISLIVYCFHVN